MLTRSIAQLLGVETLHFQQLPEVVNRFLMPPDPIVLHYIINPTTVPPERATAWDVEVKLEDLSLKHRMKSVTLDANQATVKTLGDIDDEVHSVCNLSQCNLLRHSRSQYTFSHCTIR